MHEAHPSTDDRSGLRRFFGVPFRSQTYRNIAFLALAFPLGLTYFVAVTVGLSVGAGLSLTLVGIPLLLATLLVVGYIGRFEARLTRWLLDIEVDVPEVASPAADDDLTSIDGITTAAGRLVASQTTWMSMVFVLLKFIFGVVAFTSLVTAVAVAGTLLAMPLLYDTPGVVYAVGAYPIDSLADALAGAFLGLGLVFVSLHLLNGLARMGGFLTEVLLEPDTDTTAVGGSDD
jgi:hypothetical protein